MEVAFGLRSRMRDCRFAKVSPAGGDGRVVFAINRASFPKKEAIPIAMPSPRQQGCHTRKRRRAAALQDAGAMFGSAFIGDK